MNYKKFIRKLGFTPKENTSDVFQKEYVELKNYTLEVNFSTSTIEYGNKIKVENKAAQKFSQSENWVVLECVNRLLEKGYKPENITLEKTYPSGHGTSGRLDILISQDNGSAYMMIECKIWGGEFEKELKNLHKKGGQLFTYFQQDKNANLLVLYASTLDKEKITYKNHIIKIEDDYRQTSNVKDLFDLWNKLTKDNGVFDEWVKPYAFESKALTPNQLVSIKQEDSGFIFNRFLEILRHNVVSDKPNAFNKIFTLFLCKIYDEKSTANNDELKFQWREGVDDNISFQKRLADLYKNGMKEFLDKTVTDFSDEDFDTKYKSLDDTIKKQLRDDIIKLRLEKNNEFAIKEVFDKKSFEENAKVVKQVVELLQGYKIRYTKKQQYLSDFFELLLTTGLKQESGQFFTPVPIAQFIIKSLPINDLIDEKLKDGKKGNLLPYIMDYAAGSGHFLTETMHEIQRNLDAKNPKDYISDTARKINSWQADHFDWALQYVYGIEKDYRLVKVGKVGCYLHGDGLANVIHSDGLGNFKNTAEYQNKLDKVDSDFPMENKQFDVVVSNPPYSVSSFRNNARTYYTEDDFSLYASLTDNSSEIECLFVERTQQLLKDGGMAGIILPSSILSNTGIYTKTREIILKYFDIIAITELGSNTFMATGTNTVVLFLRRKNNHDWANFEKSVDKVFSNASDITINGIENPTAKYIAHVWDGITFDDYVSLLKNKPSENILAHEIYQDYLAKLKAKDDKAKWDEIIRLEKEKLLFFILAYPQKIVLVKTGEKKVEKQFLGYEFSNRRGNEGIHPINRGKSIDECTRLFDPDVFDNPEKASTYILKAFEGDNGFPIDPSLKPNIHRLNLVDMMTFDRTDFEKSISLSTKKKVEIESKWPLAKIGSITKILNGGTPDTKNPEYWDGKVNWATLVDTKSKYLSSTKRTLTLEGVKNSGAAVLPINTVIFSSRATIGDVCISKIETCTNQGYKNFVCSNQLHHEYLYYILKNQTKNIKLLASGMTYQEISKTQISEFKIPLPPKEVQGKIVAEIGALEGEEESALIQIGGLQKKIFELLDDGGFDKASLKQLLLSINPSKKEAIANLRNSTLVNFLSMPDVSTNAQIINLQKRTLGEVKTGFTFFQEDDVLLAKITPCMENGKGALVSKLESNIGFGSTEFFVLRPDKSKILPKILYYHTKSKAFRVAAEKEMTGASGHRRVPKPFVEKYEIPIPPLNNQQKIVKKIEKIENEIVVLEQNLVGLSAQKDAVLKKHLN